MKRDLDLIREFLLKIEGGQTVFEFLSNEIAALLGTTSDSNLSTEEADHQAYNFQLLVDGGLIEASASAGGAFYVQKITWKGHDFIDAVRDPTVWARTKAGAVAVGGWTFDLVIDIAKGVIRKKVEGWSGVQL